MPGHCVKYILLISGAKMFDAIKNALGTSRLESTGSGGCGCISEGEVYLTNAGKVFIKRNAKAGVSYKFSKELFRMIETHLVKI